MALARFRFLVLAFPSAAAVLALNPRPASAQSPPPFEAPALPTESVELANGLRVLLAPDPRARLVSVGVRYGVGFADDPNGRRGLAHLAEHLVAASSEHVRDSFRLLESAGATEFNAVTSLDYTTCFETLPPERLETALWLESERMGYAAPVMNDRVFREEHDAVANEDRDASVDRIGASFTEFLSDALYPSWHPYSVNGVGAADLDAIELKDVRAFVHTWYSPVNALLAIAGRFDRDETVALVKRYFGALRASSVPSRPVLPKDEPNVGALLAAKAPALADSVLLEWRTPAYGDEGDAALDLAAMILAGAGNQRLERAVIATHAARAVGARQSSHRRESVFWINAVASPGVNPGFVGDRIQDEVDRLGIEITAEDVEQARQIWRTKALSDVETTIGRVEELFDAVERRDRLGPGFDWGFGRYERVSVQDVRRAISTWLSPATRTAIVLIADPRAERRGQLVRREAVSQ